MPIVKNKLSSKLAVGGANFDSGESKPVNSEELKSFYFKRAIEDGLVEVEKREVRTESDDFQGKADPKKKPKKDPKKDAKKPPKDEK